MIKLARSIIVFIFVFQCFVLTVSAQKFHVRQSILSMPESVAKADSLLEVLNDLKDTSEVREIFLMTTKLAAKIRYSKGVILAYDRVGVIHRNLSNYNEALVYHRKALEMAEGTANEKLIIQALNNIGVVYRRLDESKQALDYHIKALKMAEGLNDTRNTCIALNSIGNIYVALGQHQEALKFFKRALDLEKQQNNYWGISINLQNIGVVFEADNNLDSALHYYKKSLDFDILAKKENGIAICYNSIGKVYLKMGKSNDAATYFKRALAIHLSFGDKVYIADSYSNLGDSYLNLGNTDEAIQYYQQAADIAQKIGSKLRSQKACEGLSKSSEARGDFKEALRFYKLSGLYRDSIRSEDNTKHLALLQTQYDTEKQKHQIEILHREKKTARIIQIFLLALMFAGIVVSVFGFRNAYQKRKIDQQALDLKEQKIRDLEKEQRLIATHAVLQGEETERGRLARDLHDGLGGLLSGIRLNLSNIRINFLVSKDQTNVFDHALSMLDQSIRELRRVAHNMMPETLVKYGLKDALRDFCQNIEVANGPKVAFNCWGEAIRFERSLETTLYRIAMELINNAVKHSGANEIIVQIVQEPDRIYLTVHDNGKGFDPELIDGMKSSGLQNIRARVESFNGRLDVYSHPGKGTEIGIEFKI